MKGKINWNKILNYISGVTMCLSGGILVAKDNIEGGIALIVAGVAKIRAHDIQGKQLKDVKKELFQLKDGTRINGN